MDASVISAAITLLVAITGVTVTFLSQQRARKAERADVGSGDRIEALIRSLNNANDVIREIEKEIRARQGVAEKLQQDAEQAEKLLELNREELEAVRGLVGSELRSESRRGFWLGLLVNVFFFIAGAALTVILR
jgi:hypothetical protein